MKKISIVIGTRPEAIKLAPVVLALRACPEVRCHVCLTAQHRAMLDEVLRVFGIVPDADLNLMTPGQSLAALSARALESVDRYFGDQRPDLALVQGDTSTVFCATLAAFYQNVPVGHVEAGLRTGNLFSPWPEEANRVLVGRLAALHFAPTRRAAENLLNEGTPPDRVFVTGNTGIDALFLTLRRQTGISRDPQHWDGEGRMVLITAHRRENFGKRFEEVCHAIADLAQRFPDVIWIYPVHPNPNVRGTVDAILRPRGLANVRLIDPLAYPQFVSLMSQCALILTDSGGVQEEAPSLGKPVLVLRDTTERPEAVDAGTVRMVGPDRQAIVEWSTRLLSDPQEYARMTHAHNPYGDGHAAARIVRHCLDYLGVGAAPRESPST